MCLLQHPDFPSLELKDRAHQLNIFGVLGGRTSTIDQKASTPILLDLRFQLVDADKTVIANQFDITNLITFEELSDGTILIQLAIDDPEPLPDVEPEKPETPSGFDTTVEDWEIVEVPIEI